jgi:hypothetical protein
MKIFLLSFLILFVTVNTAWVSFTKRGVSVNAKGFQGYDFNTGATEIKFNMRASTRCDMFLLSETQFQNFKRGASFISLWSSKGVTSSGQQFYSNVQNIRSKLLIRK